MNTVICKKYFSLKMCNNHNKSYFTLINGECVTHQCCNLWACVIAYELIRISNNAHVLVQDQPIPVFNNVSHAVKSSYLTFHFPGSYTKLQLALYASL